MNTLAKVSDQTRNNWLAVMLLTLSGFLTALSSIYFLFLPTGGYQGGRNPTFGITILFSRETWDLLHTWAGLIMVAIAAVHIPLHWSWVVSMTKRAAKILGGQCKSMNARGKFNLLVNGVVGVSGLLAAISGLYFLFFPGSQGSHTITATILFSRATWDVIHTWSGTIMIAAAVLHFAIHWRWVTKVTGKVLTVPDQNSKGLTQQGNPVR